VRPLIDVKFGRVVGLYTGFASLLLCMAEVQLSDILVTPQACNVILSFVLVARIRRYLFRPLENGKPHLVWFHTVLTSMAMKVKIGSLHMQSLLSIQGSMVRTPFQPHSMTYIELFDRELDSIHQVGSIISYLSLVSY